MKTKIFTFSLLLVCFQLMAQNGDVVVKDLKQVKSYTYNICKTQGNCFGFGKIDDIEFNDGKVCRLLIQSDSVIIIDSYFSVLDKINLTNGEFVKRSNVFEHEHTASLREIIFYNGSILLLSEWSQNLYIINSNLSIDKTIRIPLKGYLYRFVNLNDNLYILSGKTIGYDKGVYHQVAFGIDNSFALKADTISLPETLTNEDTLVYGKKIQIITNDSLCFLRANNFLYEIPEIINDLNFYDQPIAFDDKYLVYFTRTVSNYIMTVCEYY